jgi:hypothetical protein
METESLKVLNNMKSEVFVESWNTCFGPLELHHVTSFIALGVAIDNFGSTDCAVNHRVGCFWGVMVGSQSQVLQPKGPFGSEDLEVL